MPVGSQHFGGGMRFRKRISYVDATRWFADGDHDRVETREGGRAIATPEGWRSVKSGDWILRDDCGNCWPMDNGLFTSLYEPVVE
ncbi:MULTISPECIES: hypothetical protein [Burkholderia]|uniref:Uncharacterized protein n=1 Tax=Burkholderia contaminans TaxID=488447 RepID=A0A6P2V2Z9_9BURK|nr:MULTISPECIES: hypothetical protein [Burkholderia]VWC77507.1 hypothetical protein BCO71171_00229 [Burkholderia contaminans]